MADTEASPYIDLDGLKRAVSELDRRYAGSGHSHAVADVEGLRAELDGMAPLHHAHKMEQVVGLRTALAGKSDAGHAHASLTAAAIAPGTDLDALDLADGSPALELHACADASGVLHAPEGLTGGFALAVELLRFSAPGDWSVRQSLVSSAGREWQRYAASGEWTGWRRAYTSGDMPTPAEIGAADRVHSHAVEDVTGLRAELDGKAAAVHGHSISDVESLQATLDAKAAAVHGHGMADVSGLSAALAAKADAAHLHAISDVTGLGASLQAKAPLEHGHDAATQAAAGFMSATDKKKLDGVADGATRVTAVSQIANDMDFVNSDQTREQTLEITADMATKTWVTGQDYQSGADVAAAVAGAVSTGTADMATRTWVGQQGYQDAEQVEAAVEAGTADMATQTWVAGRGYQTAEQVDTAVEAKGYQTAAQVDSAITAKGYDTAASVDSKVAAAKTELQSAISQAVASVLKWQGAVATVADLPATSTTGHVYHVDADGGEYAWDGDEWVELGSVVELTWDGITGKPTAFSPSAHTHAQSDVTGLDAALAGKSDTGHVHGIAGVTGLQSALDGKSDTGHGHAIADTSGLQAALDAKAAAGHTHTQAQVEGLADALAGKAASSHSHSQADVTGLVDALAGKAAAGHKHSAADVTSGTLPIARGGTGATTAAGALAALGAASAGHSHAVASADAAGFMSVDDRAKLDGIAAGANKYVHPAYTARAAGLYKVAVDATGHVSGATAVTKADLTALGLPSGDTTYGLATTSAAGLLRQLSGSTGQYLRGDGTWATPPNTTYGVATTSANGLMSSTDKAKLDGIATGANKTVVDSALSSTSTNPVQNKVINSALAGKAAASHTHTIAQVSNLQSTLDGKAATGHTHNYAASPSAGGAATYAYLPRTSQDANTLPGASRGVWHEYSSGAANLPSLHYYHVFTGQGTDANYNTQLALGMTTNAVYYRNRSAGTWGGWTKVYTSANKPTATEIGAAAASHSHAASAITSGTLSADRLPTVPIAKGGTGATSASAARTALGITPANIGAAASSHSHSYLPLSGGTLTGAVTHNAKNNRYTCSGGSWINGKTATNVPIVFPTASTMDGSRYDPYMWGQNADGDVWNFGAGASNQVGFFGFNSDRTANGSDWSVYLNITTGRLTASAGITGSLSGNATTASTLQTARTINGTSFNGSANITTANWGTARTLTIGSTGKSVNGSGNVSWSLSEIGAAAANHTHSGYAASSHNHAASNITSGTLSVDRLPTVSVAKGGTGATTAAQARTNLGAAASSHNHSAANITSGTLAVARGGTGVTSMDALKQQVLDFPSNEDLLAYLNS